MANKVTLVQNWAQNFNLGSRRPSLTPSKYACFVTVAFIGQARDGGGGAKTDRKSIIRNKGMKYIGWD